MHTHMSITQTIFTYLYCKPLLTQCYICYLVHGNVSCIYPYLYDSFHAHYLIFMSVKYMHTISYMQYFSCPFLYLLDTITDDMRCMLCLFYATCTWLVILWSFYYPLVDHYDALSYHRCAFTYLLLVI